MTTTMTIRLHSERLLALASPSAVKFEAKIGKMMDGKSVYFIGNAGDNKDASTSYGFFEVISLAYAIASIAKGIVATGETLSAEVKATLAKNLSTLDNATKTNWVARWLTDLIGFGLAASTTQLAQVTTTPSSTQSTPPVTAVLPPLGTVELRGVAAADLDADGAGDADLDTDDDDRASTDSSTEAVVVLGLSPAPAAAVASGDGTPQSAPADAPEAGGVDEERAPQPAQSAPSDAAANEASNRATDDGLKGNALAAQPSTADAGANTSSAVQSTFSLKGHGGTAAAIAALAAAFLIRNAGPAVLRGLNII